MPNTCTHPSNDVLNDFLLGKLSDLKDAEIESHLADCPECQARAANASVGDTLVELLAAAGTKLDAERAGAPTPTLAGAATASLFANAQARDATTPTGPADVPAALIDHPKYRVLRLLGTGGMGTVWLARHTVMNRSVAVKVIRPDLFAKPGAAGRFLREVRAAAKLHHPNIVTAFDAEAVGDSCLLVMEFVEGETLADRLKAGRLSVPEACRAVRDAARGLAHAHAAGLVHRDVKPHNLIRAADGTVKVLDFGLAGVVAGEGIAAVGDGLTGTGMVCGTSDYIAPEQIACPRTADARSDIYGLGCTLYHLLAGRPPFPNGSAAEKLDAHRERTPEPLAGVPAGLSAVVAKMMAKRPEDRYPMAEAAAAALEPFCSPPRVGRRPVVVATALFALAVLAAVTGWVIVRDKDGKVIAQVQIPEGGSVEVKPGAAEPAPPKASVLNTFPWGSNFWLSADGRRIAFASGESPIFGDVEVSYPNADAARLWGPTSLYVYDTATGKLVRRVRAPGAKFLDAVFLPGGSKLLTAERISSDNDRECRFHEWDLDTGVGRPLPHLPDPPGGYPRFSDVSADGRYLAYSDGDLVRVVELATGKVLVEVKGEEHWEYGQARLSPAGDRAITIMRGREDFTAEVRLYHLATGKLAFRTTVQQEHPSVHPLFLADDTPAVVVAERHDGDLRWLIQRLDPRSGKPAGDPVPLPSDARATAIQAGRMGFDNGDKRTRTDRVRVLDAATGKTVFEVKTEGGYASFSLSADGRVLAVEDRSLDIIDGQRTTVYRLPAP